VGNEWTDDDTLRLRELHAQGMSRNDIAREMDRSGSTISRHAAAAGLSFERGPEVEAATAAKIADAKARRAQMMLDLLDDADKLRLQLFAATTIHSFGGKDHTYNSKHVDQPLFKDQRDIMGAVSLALNASMRLDHHDTDGGAEGARSMVSQLFGALKTVADQLDDEGVADDAAHD
jgi:hypothetical protein